MTWSDAAEDPVADLLGHDGDRVVACGGLVLRVGGRERDQQQRHTDSVVEAALDIEPLSNA
jgi:hypothetical protein